MAATDGVEIREAIWPEDLAEVARLFEEYVASLGVDLSFQRVEEELTGLPGKYARPGGFIFLGGLGGRPVAVGACRALSAGVCEMKRLYVRPEARGLGLGRRLAERIIEEARKAGYSAVALDSLGSMREAQQLYQSLGFGMVEPYYANPLPGTVYMKRTL
jgi:ribosomal protein S18 acetylase RimI-like enzyme